MRKKEGKVMHTIWRGAWGGRMMEKGQEDERGGKEEKDEWDR